MVSNAEAAEGSRRPPSVASRSSRPNAHHRGRSHYGSSSYAPTNEFPFFSQSGDVEILITCDGQEKRYLLHRLMMSQFSGFFEAGMSEEWSRTHALRAAPKPPQARPDQQLSVVGELPSSSELTGPPVSADPITTKPVGRRRWRYELNWEDVGEDDEPILDQRNPPQGSLFMPLSSIPPPVAPRAKPSGSHSFFRSMANLSISAPHPAHASQSVANLATPIDPALSNPLLRDYDNLFRMFYNYAPILNSSNIASAYSECKSLLALADMYDALPVVGPRVEHHLLAFSSRLFKQIAKYPPSYLKLGYLARSKVIFSEALTHVVGQWPLAYPYLKPNNHTPVNYEVPERVLDLIEDSVEELAELKGKIEAKLFRLTLTTSRGERVNPSNDYLGWLAISLWRQWLAENTTPEVRGILKNSPGNSNSRPIGMNNNDPNPPMSAATSASPPLNTGRIYRLIASTNPEVYLAHDEIKRFLKLYPSTSSSNNLYTRENLKRFERKIDQIKNIARDVVKPLTRNCLELDIRSLSDGQGGGLGYLTCIKVADGDMPWDS